VSKTGWFYLKLLEVWLREGDIDELQRVLEEISNRNVQEVFLREGFRSELMAFAAAKGKHVEFTTLLSSIPNSSQQQASNVNKSLPAEKEDTYEGVYETSDVEEVSIFFFGSTSVLSSNCFSHFSDDDCPEEYHSIGRRIKE